MYRKLILALIPALLFSAAAEAQNIGEVKRRLAEPEMNGEGRTASVQVTEHGTATDAVRRGDASGAQTVNGFRIVIFFDNGATARADAEHRMSEFTAAYPDIRCDIRYENPYFKVIAGYCVTSDEAVMLLERIRRDFPQAYIMREELPVRRLITPKPVIDSDIENSEEEETETPDGESGSASKM